MQSAAVTKMTKGERSRALLPEAVTVLGVPRLFLVEHPTTGALYECLPPAGTVLVCDDDGRSMFILKPIRDAGKPRSFDQALRAEGLYERFTNRKADGFYNCFVPSLRRPQFRGRLVIIRYLAEKNLDEDSDGEEIEWEHYFEAPDYPNLWSVGKDQYFVEPGKWCVGRAGIQHSDDDDGE